jgi:hypothetical protein
MRFDVNDENAFYRTRDQLLDRFMAGSGADEDCRCDVELALDWKWGYGDGDLASWTQSELAEFLLEWCPRKVSIPPEEARSIPISLAGFLGFLADEGLVDPRRVPVARLQADLAGMGDEVVAAMGDRSRFGMAKSLFTGMAGPDAEIDLTDGAALQALMDQFNALPFEARGEILGMPAVPEDPWLALTDGLDLSPAPPLPADELATLARATPIARHIRMAREFIADGRKLTAKGNLSVADAKALAAILDDPSLAAQETHGWSIRSADDLPLVQFVLRWARAAGALRVAKGRMLATASWGKLDPLAQLRKATSALLDQGPLELRTGDGQWVPGPLLEVLDEGALHLLAVLWAVPDGIGFDDLIEGVNGVCEMELSSGPGSRAEARARQIRHETDLLFDTLALAGLVVREGDEHHDDQYGIDRRTGGTLSLTPLGRVALGPYLNTHGYPIPEIGELSHQPLTALFARIGHWTPDRTRVEFDHWVQRHSASQAIDQMTELLERYTDPRWPIAAVDLAGRLGPSREMDALRRFLETPAAGHAATRLMDLGQPVDIDHASMMRAGIELLSIPAEGGDMDEEFLAVVGQIDNLGSFIDEVWRVPIPASAMVLDAIGRVHPDKGVAKQARKAAFKHRSLTANGTRPG